MTHGVGSSADAWWLGTGENTAVTQIEQRLNYMPSHLSGCHPRQGTMWKGRCLPSHLCHFGATLAPGTYKDPGKTYKLMEVNFLLSEGKGELTRC